MLGKNRGRVLSRRRNNNATQTGPDDAAVQRFLATLPPKLGSELSLIEFADPVEPSTLIETLRCKCVHSLCYRPITPTPCQVTSVSKKAFFPLESCFDFTVRNTALFDPLTSDPAYLHAVIFGTQAYIDLASGRRKRSDVAQSPSEHRLKTIQLLRERISAENEPSSISDPTILIVLTLTQVAHLTGDYVIACHHMQGLAKIVKLRGGIDAFRDCLKLLTELLRSAGVLVYNARWCTADEILFRCDMGLAMYWGTTPVFDYQQSPPQILTCPLEQTVASSSSGEISVIAALDGQLARIWTLTSNFCHTINSIAATKEKLSDQILLESMSSITCPLLRISFAPESVNEAVRLGLIAFCSDIFLKRQNLHPPQHYLSVNYKRGFQSLESLRGDQSRISLWYLMIGAISLFHEDTEEREWCTSSLRTTIDANEVRSWTRMRQILKSFPWIDIVDDRPGKVIFEKVVKFGYNHCH